MKITDFTGVNYVLDPVFAENYQINTECIARQARWVNYSGN